MAVRFTCIVLLTSLLCGPLQADDDLNTILVGGDYWCPYVCDPGSEKEGYIVEALRRIFAPHGYTIRFRLYPWQRALQLTEVGRIDGAVGAVKGNRGANIIGAQSLGRDDTVIVHRSDTSLDYRVPRDLDGLRIGMVAEYTYDNHGSLDDYLATRQAARNGVLVVTQSKPLEQLFQLLMLDRIQAFPENRFVAAFNAQQMGLQQQITYTQHTEGDDIHVAFSPSKRGRTLLRIFDAGMEALRANGELDTILERYGIPETFH